MESELGGMRQTAGDSAVPWTCTSVATVCSERFREILAHMSSGAGSCNMALQHGTGESPK